jgi:hypothetical protein
MNWEKGKDGKNLNFLFTVLLLTVTIDSESAKFIFENAKVTVITASSVTVNGSYLELL